MSALSSTRSGLWLGRAALFLGALAMLAPFWIAFKTALTPSTEIYESAGSILPRDPTWFNFQRVLGLAAADDPRLGTAGLPEINFARVLLNTTWFTLLAVVPQVLFSALAAYAFARLQFPGRNLIFFLFIAASMIPAAVLFLPNFILVREMGLLNTYLGMALPFALMTPFAVFYLRQVFLATPRDVEEAARIDGASFFTIFWRIILPLHRTPIATLSILATLSAWNEFFWPFLTGRKESVQVITVALNMFRTQQARGAPDWTGLMACAILGALPMLVLLVFFGRRIVQSFQFSGGR